MTDDITKNMTIDDKLDFIINTVSDMNRRQTAFDERLTGLDERLTGLEDLLQARLHDTRPLWEGVLQRLDAQQQQLDALLQRLDAQQQQLDEIRVQLSRLDKKLDFAAHDNQRANLDMRADMAMLTERITALEKAA